MKRILFWTTIAAIWTGASIALLTGCAGVKFSINYAKQDTFVYPTKTMSGNVIGRSSNPKEFKEVLTYLGFEIFDKPKEGSK